MRYFLQRLGVLTLSLWIATTMNFFIPRMVPGNPAETYIARMQGRVDPRTLHAIEMQFGISHQPLYVQYFQYLWNISHGQFGISVLYYPAKVTTVIASALPWTLGLVGITTVIAFVIGTLLGIYNSWRRNGISDSVVSPILMFIQSIPAFWLGLIMLWYFGLDKGWFPLNHSYSDGTTPSLHLSFILDVLHHAFLPAFAIFITSVGWWLLGMRNNMVQVLADDYIVFAEAKGISQRRLMLNYAARNAMLPSLTGFGMALAGVVGGSLLVEQVFSYPGIGYQFVNAVMAQDYPLMQALFLLITVATLIANFLVDMLYGRLDPRVRVEGETS